ncbi:MAG: Ribosomal large subunit pseudouridine synthase D [bacterium ADurb.Bin400]|nr:MAG: Ribosomal large subunit pseudouridine synthase D [bacterium ADurb.Bin400]
MGTIISHLGRHPTNRQKVANIGPEKGREAISNYRAIKYFIDASANRISLLEFDIKTGRTHQIRVHASDMGNPIIGDMVYGSKNSIKISTSHGVSRQLLHAKSLTFYLPGETVARTFEAPLPEDYCNFLDKLRTIDEID